MRYTADARAREDLKKICWNWLSDPGEFYRVGAINNRTPAEGRERGDTNPTLVCESLAIGCSLSHSGEMRTHNGGPRITAVSFFNLSSPIMSYF